MLPLSRRIHPRYSVCKIVSYHNRDSSVLTHTLDLGLGGMKIKTQFPLPKDKSLRFKLVLGANSMWLRGRVVYSRLIPDQQVVAGIQFMELSDRNHHSLKNYLATLQDHDLGLPQCDARGHSAPSRSQG